MGAEPVSRLIHHLRPLIEALPFGVFVASVEGQIVLANRYFWECCGWLFEAVSAAPHRSADRHVLRQRFIAGNRQALAEGLLITEEQMPNLAGAQRTFEVRRFPVPGDAGETLVGGIVWDATERARGEQSRQMLVSALEHSPAIIFITDAEGHLLYANRKYEELTGYSLEESLGKLPRALDPAHLTPEEYRERWDAIRAGREWRGEFLNHKKGGEPYWELVHISPIRDEDGTLMHIVLVKQDITRRKQMEQAEREQRERAEALSETAALLTRTLDLERVFDHILTQAARLVPYDAGHLGILEGDRMRIVRTLGYARYGGDEAVLATSLPVDELINLHTIVRTRQPLIIPDISSDPYWVHLAEPRPLRACLGVPLVMHDEVLGVLDLFSETPGFFTQEHAYRLQALADLAAQAVHNARLYQSLRDHASALEDRVAERTEALRQSEERARAQYKAVPVPTFLMQHRPDGQFALVDYNDAAYEFSEGLVANWVREAMADFHRDYPHLIELARQCLEQRVTLQREMYFTNTSGKRYYVQVTASFLPPDRILVHMVDLTERWRYEETLRAALEREKYLGELRARLVTTVSHQFRTPLSIILSSADILDRYLDRLSDADRQKRIAHIREAVARIVQLLDDTLELDAMQVGERPLKPEPVDVAVLCEQIIVQVSGAKGNGVRTRLEVTGCSGLVLLDREVFGQILQRLVSNAVKFSRPGGEVMVRVSCREGRIVVQVQDQGIGIPLADRSHVFEGFFRGSNVGEIPGTGLGLAIVRQAVELHGGTVGFESQEGQGTTFTVTLPWVPAHQEGAP